MARIPNTNIVSKPKEAGRGAERLSTPNPQGIHRRSLLGPRFQQGWAVEAADGQLDWVEGSAEEELVHHNSSMVQQQRQQQQEARHKYKYLEIPRSNAGSAQTPTLVRSSSAIVTPRRRTLSRSPSATTTGITSRAPTHSSGTTASFPVSASPPRPGKPRKSAVRHRGPTRSPRRGC